MFDKKNKNSLWHHGALSSLIAVLLGFILIVLIFKTGMLVGKSKSHFSASKAGNYHKNFSKHMGKKFSSWKKSAYSSYKEVVKLTESGFVVKGADGEEQEVVVSQDTVILKGEAKIGNTVSVGDKVYVTGSLVEASMVKIFDPSLKK